MLPNTDEYWTEIEYAQKYGKKKLMSEFMEYEKITGKDWSESLLSFDPSSQSIEKFHREVVIPLLAERKIA
jgi:hypothetical protein